MSKKKKAKAIETFIEKVKEGVPYRCSLLGAEFYIDSNDWIVIEGKIDKISIARDRALGNTKIIAKVLENISGGRYQFATKVWRRYGIE